jgi:glutamate synthase domain-containing protein 3
MTGGTAVILGKTGRNFAAGMSEELRMYLTRRRKRFMQYGNGSFRNIGR